jgi:hypothetical protein
MLRNGFYLSFAFIFILVLESISTSSYQLNKSSDREDQDTIIINRLQYLQEPDTINYHFIKTAKKADSQFTYKSYVDFLLKVSDTSKYIIIKLDEFLKTVDTNKVVIGLRHDVDLDLKKAFKLSTVENNLGIRSSYYILHTAAYYLADPNNMEEHSDSIIPTLKIIQNDYNDEIGWHNDLVTIQLVYDIDPVIFLNQELSWLRSNGLNLTGTSSHGSNYCYVYYYLNYYFFEEFKNSVAGQFVNNDSALVYGKWVKFKHGRLSDFGLDYEAYFLNNNKYYSDASFINGNRWNINMLDLSTLKRGDRVIILMHPVYYSQIGSPMSEITSFNVAGQIRSEIDDSSATIYVEIPAGIRRDSLKAVFSLSPDARALLGSKELHSGLSSVDFTNPVIIRVVAEDGLSFTSWLVNVVNSKSSLILSTNKLFIGSAPNSTASFEITSNLSWRITSTEEWLSASYENGNGNATVIITAQANPELSSREAIMTISGDGIEDQYIIFIQEAVTTGIDQGTGEINNILIYPNPVHTVLFIDGTYQNTWITIMDNNGRILMDSELHDNRIDISSLSDGVYIIRITAGGKTVIKKFVKN